METNPDLIKMSRVKKNELILDITGLDKSILVHGRVLGPKAGSILMERR